MDRGSDKHGPMVDDTLKKETRSLEQGGVESKSDETKEKEPSGEDQPVSDESLSRVTDQDAPLQRDPGQVEERSDIARSLQPSAFPGDREALLRSAREMQAPGPVIDRLRRLPADREFENVQQVWAALGGKTEEREGLADADEG